MRNRSIRPFREGWERTELEEATKTRCEDESFAAAMRAAIAKGKEHPPVGIFKDETPLVPTRFQPEPRMSCTGSQASLCAEHGDRWERTR
jgi:hypothetical protein